MRKLIATLVGAVVLVGGLAGCPGNGNNDGQPATGDWEFTERRQAAVTNVVEQLIATGEALATLSSLADPRLDLEGSAFGTFGTCPVVTYFGSGGSGTATFDFGDGCTGALTGPPVVRGEVSLSPSLTADAFRARYSNLFIDGREVTGSLDPLRIADQDAGGTVDTAVAAETDLEIEDVGEVRGSLEVDFSAEGVITVSGGDVRLDVGETVYIADLVNITFDPPVNGNLIPESGTVTFLDTQLVAISVTFSDRSVETGLVRVIVGNGSMQSFTPVEVP